MEVKAGKMFRNFLRGLMHENVFSYFLFFFSSFLIFSSSHLYVTRTCRKETKCPVMTHYVRSLILENVLFRALILFLSLSLSHLLFLSLSLFHTFSPSLSHILLWLLPRNRKGRGNGFQGRKEFLYPWKRVWTETEWETERHKKYFSCKWREFKWKKEFFLC